MNMKFARATRFANLLTAIIIVGVPFSAFLTTWAASGLGHYTLLRLWPELLLLLLTVVTCGWLVREAGLRRWLAASVLVRLIVLYALLTLLLGAVAYAKGDVTPKALGYGLLVNLRFLLFFVDVSVLVQRSPWLQRHWRQLLLGPALLVAAFAVLQYTALPHDFLAHFGYGKQTIAPVETINNNPHYIRVGSFLRGANPLGAYLVVILAALVAAWSVVRRQFIYGMVAILSVFGLLFSFSRSAWIGAAVAVGLAVWLRLPTRRWRFIAAGGALGLVLVAGGLLLAFHHNAPVQDALYHTDKQSKISVSSNQAHASALQAGLSDVVHEPLGRGPGTAGPASAYNGDHGSRIAENYFVQIAQEVGWAGLLLFLAIVVIVGVELFRAAGRSPLALALGTSLVGVSFVNLLSHAWTDPTLAYIWWGLGAVCLATPMAKKAAKKQIKKP